MLERYFKDNTRARILETNGTYKRVKPADGEKPFDIQNHLMGY